MTIVTTKEQLRAAVQKKEENIEIKENLAKELRWLKKLSPQKIILLTTLLASTVVSNPLSSLTFIGIAKITGVDYNK